MHAWIGLGSPDCVFAVSALGPHLRRIPSHSGFQPRQIQRDVHHCYP